MISRLKAASLGFLVWLVLPASLLAAEGPALVSDDLVGKIIVVAALVSATVQAVKKFLPSLVEGRIAVALAVVGAAAAVFATSDPALFFTAEFFTQLVWTILGALGIHGLVKVAGTGK